jgi:hypothetical protein
MIPSVLHGAGPSASTPSSSSEPFTVVVQFANGLSTQFLVDASASLLDVAMRLPAATATYSTDATWVNACAMAPMGGAGAVSIWNNSIGVKQFATNSNHQALLQLNCALTSYHSTGAFNCVQAVLPWLNREGPYAKALSVLKNIVFTFVNNNSTVFQDPREQVENCFNAVDHGLTVLAELGFTLDAAYGVYRMSSSTVSHPVLTALHALLSSELFTVGSQNLVSANVNNQAQFPSQFPSGSSSVSGAGINPITGTPLVNSNPLPSFSNQFSSSNQFPSQASFPLPLSTWGQSAPQVPSFFSQNHQPLSYGPNWNQSNQQQSAANFYQFPNVASFSSSSSTFGAPRNQPVYQQPSMDYWTNRSQNSLVNRSGSLVGQTPFNGQSPAQQLNNARNFQVNSNPSEHRIFDSFTGFSFGEPIPVRRTPNSHRMSSLAEELQRLTETMGDFKDDDDDDSLQLARRLQLEEIRRATGRPLNRNVVRFFAESNAPSRGLDAKIIKQFKVIKIDRQIFSKSNDHLGSVHCTICLEEWKLKERVTELPCNHFFHQECIEKWLTGNRKCPLDNLSLEKTPSSKPTNPPPRQTPARPNPPAPVSNQPPSRPTAVNNQQPSSRQVPTQSRGQTTPASHQSGNSRHHQGRSSSSANTPRSSASRGRRQH